MKVPKSSAGVRTFACPNWLIEELAELLALRGLSAKNGDELVFLSPDGAPLAYPNWRSRVWQPACKKAGLADLRFHDLRSLAATALIAVGTDVKTAQARLGHSSSRMTLDVYARVDTKADQAAADKVGEFLRPSRTPRSRTKSTVNANHKTEGVAFGYRPIGTKSAKKR